MKVSFEGIGEGVATFEAETTGAGAVVPGKAVTVSGNGKVSACTKAGDIPAGVALSVRGDFAAVQVSGYVKLPCDSSLPLGWQAVAMDSAGKLTAAGSGGRQLLVVDTDGGECGVIL